MYVYDGLTMWSTGGCTGGLGGGAFAGTQIQEVLLRWDTNLDDGVFVDVDNVCIEQVLSVPGLNGACCIEDPMGWAPCSARSRRCGLHGDRPVAPTLVTVSWLPVARIASSA